VNRCKVELPCQLCKKLRAQEAAVTISKLVVALQTSPPIAENSELTAGWREDNPYHGFASVEALA
jgi:hypothetical protein